MNKSISVALVGNPNSGKTTIFNALTGSRQKVGNYPGVTVEKKEGVVKKNGRVVKVVDLPGTYSLTAYSTEELVTRDYLFDQKPDVVVDVIDATNLERNLYLAVQLIEMRVPLVLVFNMSDLARQRGLEIDYDQMSKLLGVAIVQTVGSKEEGIDELLDSILNYNHAEADKLARVNYGNEIGEEIGKIKSILDEENKYSSKYGSEWMALKIIERDKDILKKCHSDRLFEQAEKSVERLKSIYNDEPEIVIADKRYGFVSGACEETVRDTIEARHNFSDQIDRVVTTPVFGLVLFAAVMYFIFWITFTFGQYPTALMEKIFMGLANIINSNWPMFLSEELRSLLVDGIIGGVGGVLTFLPNILLLFLAIACLEDSGYMARAAFIMDRIMHKIGLHGKSFIPMLIGFGCSVPAIMATRILENRRNRLTTIMVVPLMSCGARFPIYSLFIPAFFPAKFRGPILWLIYVIGIVIAVVCARLLRSTVFKGKTMPFVMELPPYRMPTVKGLTIHMWERGWMYVKKAGTVILMISVVLWAASRYPRPSAENLEQFNGDKYAEQSYALEHSVTGRIGKAIEPAIKPLGFDWRIGTALIGATAAKEVFVSQLGIVFSLGEVDSDSENSDTLRSILRENYTPLVAFCIMLFCLIYAPCFATVAVTWKETGGFRWALFQFFGLTILAYVLTLIVYQVGRVVLNII